MTKELQSSRYIVISFLVREMWNRITRTLQQVKKGETNYSTVYTWKRRSHHGCFETLQNDLIEKNDSIWLSAFITFLLGTGTALLYIIMVFCLFWALASFIASLRVS